MSEPRPLHRLFGLSWMDFFAGTDVTVEAEVDLSLKQQFLDLVIIHKGSGPVLRPLPDGFGDLAAYNLVTFKSHQDTFDADALWELVGHFVNYRKQVSPSLNALLPATDFRLFAVCARFPHNLAQLVELHPLSEGVYEIRGLGLRIRVIVASQLPQAGHNAMLHLFSASKELLRYGRFHYRPYSEDTSTLLYKLLQAYSEDPTMSELLKEFVRQTLDEMVHSLPEEERLKGISPEKLLAAVPEEERIKGISPEKLLAAVPKEDRLKGLSPEEVIQGLAPETLEALVRKLKANGSSSKSE